MRADSRDWCDGLRAFVDEFRRERPPAVSEGPEAAAERGILAAHLVSWCDGLADVLEARRRWAAAEGRAEADPAPPLVLTTSPTGLVVAADLMAGGHPLAAAEAGRLVPVTELEYRLWCLRHPDEGHRLHVNHWNWIKTSVPRQREAEFARHPLAAGEAYWLHRAGTAGAGAADRRDCHLWKWTGRQAALLEPFVREARVAHFARPDGAA